MKKTLKHIAVTISIAAVISVAACSKKDASQPTTPAQNTVVDHYIDFRDSLVGNYNCADSSCVLTPPDSIAVVGLGNGPVAVTKYNGDDSSVVINGNTYYFSSSDSMRTTFSLVTENASISHAYFGKHNGYLWFQYYTWYSRILTEYYFYAGYKQ